MRSAPDVTDYPQRRRSLVYGPLGPMNSRGPLGFHPGRACRGFRPSHRRHQRRHREIWTPLIWPIRVCVRDLAVLELGLLQFGLQLMQLAQDRCVDHGIPDLHG